MKPNYLDYVPVRSPSLTWSLEENGLILLHVTHRGVLNRLAQILLRRPKISHIQMERCGSFIWPLIDGRRTIYEIGLLVKEQFGQEAEPLFERLSLYFHILKQNGYIRFLPFSPTG